MKITKITTALLLAIAVIFTSCEKWIDTDLNVDPDAPSDVPLSMLLPTIQANAAFDLSGNDAVMPTHCWMQYFSGYARQAQIYSIYKVTPADVNNLWNGIFAESAMNSKVLIDKATNEEAPHSAAVGEIMLAYIMSITTDLFGDVPYSEAFQGSENYTPVVDPQQQIYQSIDELLNSAIAHLGEEDLVGIEGDMMHGGDPDPRRPLYAALSDAGTYTGNSPGVSTIEGISFPGEYLASQDVPVTAYFMTYSECKFIEAEALLSSDADAAAEAYKEGVLASIAQVLGDTTGTTAWFDANIGNETGSSLTLRKIITQKYLANYGLVQPFNDYRRTGFPQGLETPADATTPMPVRFPYAQEEITYNSNVEDLWQNTVFLNTRVWWDAN